MNVPISWKSKTLTRVNLSSAEAEFVGLSELVKEIHFVLKILEFLHVNVELPVDVFIDNIGAIYMARNNCKGKGTRHVDMRYHYCREVHGRMIRLIFVRSALNEADMMTKNATTAEQTRHAPKVVDAVPADLHSPGDLPAIASDIEITLKSEGH